MLCLTWLSIEKDTGSRKKKSMQTINEIKFGCYTSECLIITLLMSKLVE